MHLPSHPGSVGVHVGTGSDVIVEEVASGTVRNRQRLQTGSDLVGRGLGRTRLVLEQHSLPGLALQLQVRLINPTASSQVYVLYSTRLGLYTLQLQVRCTLCDTRSDLYTLQLQVRFMYSTASGQVYMLYSTRLGLCTLQLQVRFIHSITPGQIYILYNTRSGKCTW